MNANELLDGAYQSCSQVLDAIARRGTPAAGRDGIILLADLDSKLGRHLAVFAVANNSSGKLTIGDAAEVLAEEAGPLALLVSIPFVEAFAKQDASGALARFARTPPPPEQVRVLAVTDSGLGPGTLNLPASVRPQDSSRPPPTTGVTFEGTERDSNGGVHHVYKAESEVDARRFLAGQAISGRMLFIHVETPDGAWGRDVDGLFLEELRPWQSKVKGVKARATIRSIPSRSQLNAAAEGISDNFLAELECGTCGHAWTDGVAYGGKCVVRCEGCRGTAVVDSSPLVVVP